MDLPGYVPSEGFEKSCDLPGCVPSEGFKKSCDLPGYVPSEGFKKSVDLPGFVPSEGVKKSVLLPGFVPSEGVKKSCDLPRVGPQEVFPHHRACVPRAGHQKVREDVPRVSPQADDAGASAAFFRTTLLLGGIECLISEITISKKKWILVWTYNPNKSMISSHLDTLGKNLSHYLSSYDNVILLGDRDF